MLSMRARVFLRVSKMHSVSFELMRQYQTKDPSRLRKIQTDSAQWFWQGDPPAADGELPPWTAYQTAQAVELERAYRGGEAGATVGQGGADYEIDFASMQQFKTTNHFHRRDVRRRGPQLRAAGAKTFSLAGGAAADVEGSMPRYWATDRAVLRANLATKVASSNIVDVPAGSDTFVELQSMLDTTMYRGDGPPDAPGPHGSKFGLVPGCRPDSGRLGDPGRMELVKVERNENAFLWQRYAVRCAEVQARAVADGTATAYLTERPVKPALRCDQRAPGDQINEIYAFHGTGGEHVDSICQRGFDGRIPKAEGDFGRGIYFAEHVSKSNQYVNCPRCRRGSIGTKHVDPPWGACKCTAAQVEAHNGGVYKMLVCRVVLGNPRIVSHLEYTKVAATERDFTNVAGGIAEPRQGWGGPGTSGLNAVPDVPSPADLSAAELGEVLDAMEPALSSIDEDDIDVARAQGQAALAAILVRAEREWRRRFRLPAQEGTEQCDVIMSEDRAVGGIFNLREYVAYDGALTYPEYVLHYKRVLPEGVPPPA